jgi:hypothetical protein
MKMKKFQEIQKILLVLSIALLFCCDKNDKEIVINLNDIQDIITETFSELTVLDNKRDTVYFKQVADIILDANSDIIVIDVTNSRLIQLDKDCNFKRYVGEKGSDPGEFNSIRGGVCYNNNYYIVDRAGQLIQKYDNNMNYITSYKTKLNRCTDIAFLHENEIISIHESSDNYIFCTRDTLGTIVRIFGNIAGNEKGLIIKDKQVKAPVRFVYDTLHKHIFLVSTFEPIIRRFDLEGNLLQQINIKGSFIDTIRFASKVANQDYARMSNVISGVPFLRNPSLAEGRLLVNIGMGGVGTLVLYYDKNGITDRKMIKYEIESRENISGTLGLKDFSNINMKLLYDPVFEDNILVSKD